jgi:hypothetical protein
MDTESMKYPSGVGPDLLNRAVGKLKLEECFSYRRNKRKEKRGKRVAIIEKVVDDELPSPGILDGMTYA